MRPKISVVIPAFSVEKTVKNIVSMIRESKLVFEVIVIDNNSTDRTYDFAKSAGAKIFSCKQQGLGYAMKLGIQKCKSDLVMKIDGDIKNPKTEWVSLLYNSLDKDTIFSNGYYESDYDQFPVNTLVAKPALRLFYPKLDFIKIPLSGTYIFRKNYFNFVQIPNDWAFDIAMLLNAFKMEKKIGQVDLGLLSDKQKVINEYSEMAYDILKYIIFSVNKRNIHDPSGHHEDENNEVF